MVKILSRKQYTYLKENMQSLCQEILKTKVSLNDAPYDNLSADKSVR